MADTGWCPRQQWFLDNSLDELFGEQPGWAVVWRTAWMNSCLENSLDELLSGEQPGGAVVWRTAWRSSCLENSLEEQLSGEQPGWAVVRRTAWMSCCLENSLDELLSGEQPGWAVVWRTAWMSSFNRPMTNFSQNSGVHKQLLWWYRRLLSAQCDPGKQLYWQRTKVFVSHCMGGGLDKLSDGEIWKLLRRLKCLAVSEEWGDWFLCWLCNPWRCFEVRLQNDSLVVGFWTVLEEFTPSSQKNGWIAFPRLELADKCDWFCVSALCVY